MKTGAGKEKQSPTTAGDVWGGGGGEKNLTTWEEINLIQSELNIKPPLAYL